MTDIQKIKAKLTALIAKAKSTTNEHEAAAFMAKAEELMEQYQIEVYELGDESDLMGLEHMLDSSIAAPVWLTSLPRAIALYYGCKTMRNWKAPDGTTNKKYTITLVGRESARITTMLMTDFIIDQVKAEGAKLAPQIGVSKDKATLRVANALVSRIYGEISQRKPDEAGTVAAKNALIIRNEVDAFFEKAFPNAVMKNGRSRITNELAIDAANRVSLHRQTTGSTAPRIGGR